MKKQLAILTLVAMCSSVSAFAMDGDKMQAMVDHKMKMMDTDGDGMVSKAEFTAYQDKMFDKADTNHDGMLSKDEMMAAMKKEHKMMKEHASMGNKSSMSAPIDKSSMDK